MSFNDTTFKYEDAKKYFENLNACNSDNDCPGNSPCVGNKCIVKFYCKKGDSTCTVNEDDEICFDVSKGNACKIDDDCAFTICGEDGFCIKRERICDEFSVGNSTYENVKNYLESDINKDCSDSSECPENTECENGGCIRKISFYCNKNNSTCSLSPVIKDGIAILKKHECNRNEDCVSNYCKKNRCKNVYLADNRGYGLGDDNKCWKNEECHSNHCSLGAFKYYCREPSDSEGMIAIFYIPVFFVIYGIVILIFYFIWKYVKRYFNEKDKVEYRTNNEEMELIDKSQ